MAMVFHRFPEFFQATLIDRKVTWGKSLRSYSAIVSDLKNIDIIYHSYIYIYISWIRLNCLEQVNKYSPKSRSWLSHHPANAQFVSIIFHFHNPYHPWDRYVYLHEWLIFLGKRR